MANTELQFSILAHQHPPFNAQANKVGQASTNHHITTSPHHHITTSAPALRRASPTKVGQARPSTRSPTKVGQASPNHHINQITTSATSPPALQRTSQQGRASIDKSTLSPTTGRSGPPFDAQSNQGRASINKSTHQLISSSGRSTPALQRTSQQGRASINKSTHQLISTSTPALQRTSQQGRAGPPFDAQSNQGRAGINKSQITTSPHQHINFSAFTDPNPLFTDFARRLTDSLFAIGF